jgi:S1-C subfamily serine protease
VSCRGALVAALAALAAAAVGACGSGASVSPAPTALAVRAAGCSAVDSLATGARVRPRLVLTVAHVLHGADAVTVDGQPATVVALDDRLDAALLSVAPSAGADAPVEMAARPSSGAARVVTADGASAAPVSRVVEADVEVDGAGTSDPTPRSTLVHRRVLELARAVESGESGAPVVDRRGRLIGMVFATSREGDRSYAVTVDELRPFVAAADPDAPPVALGSCR